MEQTLVALWMIAGVAVLAVRWSIDPPRFSVVEILFLAPAAVFCVIVWPVMLVVVMFPADTEE